MLMSMLSEEQLYYFHLFLPMSIGSTLKEKLFTVPRAFLSFKNRLHFVKIKDKPVTVNISKDIFLNMPITACKVL